MKITICFVYIILAVLIILSGCMSKANIPAVVNDTGPSFPADNDDTSYLTPALLDGTSQNPIISHIYTADPTARVFNGRVYVYASHDLDTQSDYDMRDYHIFSSDDLVNWQDHGVGLDAADIPWANLLYAPDCIYNESTDKYYLYFPNGAENIGVAVSDNPAGPFVDAIGAPLVTKSYPGCRIPWLFDPSVFIDDDHQAYLYFGGGMPDTGDNARVIRLNADMISLKDKSATTIVAPDFFEAAFAFKRNNNYYFTYSTNWKNGHGIRIDYLMSTDPMTGFVYKGTVIENPPKNGGNNNHHSIVEFKDRSYIFYHTRKLALSNHITTGFQRSITFDPLTYESAGHIKKATLTAGTVPQLKNVDAFSQIEAELMAVQFGVEIEFVYQGDIKVGVNLTDIQHADWTGISKVDFGKGAVKFNARVASENPGGQIEVWIDGGANNGGILLGCCEVPDTTGLQEWVDVSCDINPVHGVHNLYLIFKGEKKSDTLFNFDYYSFE